MDSDCLLGRSESFEPLLIVIRLRPIVDREVDFVHLIAVFLVGELHDYKY